MDEVKHVPGMEHYVAASMAYYLSMMTTSHYPGLSQFIDFVMIISVIIGFHSDLPIHVYGGDGANA